MLISCFGKIFIVNFLSESNKRGKMDEEFTEAGLVSKELSPTSYLAEISKIGKSDKTPEDKLNLLDVVVKDFLVRRYHIRKDTEYSDLIDLFLKKNKPVIAIFCHEITKQMYSGDKANDVTITAILEDAKNMIEQDVYGENLGAKSSESLVSSLVTLFKGKKNNTKTDLKSVSKQTEKVIEKSLGKDGLEIDKSNNVKEEIDDYTYMEDLRKKLDLESSNDAQAGAAGVGGMGGEGNDKEDGSGSGSDLESISSIDDLERIKEKIRYKKIMNAREKRDLLIKEKS